MRPRPWLVPGTMPACEPVNETASQPRSINAIESRAIEIRSPAVRSMSCSRGCGSGEISRARSIRRSVVSPIAETTTQTPDPPAAVAATRRATRLISSGTATEVPPYFWPTTLIGSDPPAPEPAGAVGGRRGRHSRGDPRLRSARGAAAPRPAGLRRGDADPRRPAPDPVPDPARRRRPRARLRPWRAGRDDAAGGRADRHLAAAPVRLGVPDRAARAAPQPAADLAARVRRGGADNRRRGGGLPLGRRPRLGRGVRARRGRLADGPDRRDRDREAPGRAPPA